MVFLVLILLCNIKNENLVLLYPHLPLPHTCILFSSSHCSYIRFFIKIIFSIYVVVPLYIIFTAQPHSTLWYISFLVQLFVFPGVDSDFFFPFHLQECILKPPDKTKNLLLVGLHKSYSQHLGASVLLVQYRLVALYISSIKKTKKMDWYTV